MSGPVDIVSNDAGELVRREHARDLGAGVVVALYRLARLAQVHDLQNQAFLRQLEQAHELILDYGLRAGLHVNILFAKRAVFVAGQLLKGARGTYESAEALGEILEWCGGSELTVARDVSRDELRAFAEAISQAMRQAKGRGFRSPSPKIRLRAVADAARLRGLEVETLPFEHRVVRTYASAVVIMRRFFEDLAARRYVLPRRVKRIAQNLVDLSEGRAPAFLGVTEMRNANHDEAGRAANSAILAVAMARELCDDRVLLAQVAMAAMMHDVARPRAAALARSHGPQLSGIVARLGEDAEDGVVPGTAAMLTALGRMNEPSIRRTVVAFEAQWLRRARSLGPTYRGVRPPTLQARCVAIARRYNDLMTPEPGLEPPLVDTAIATLAEELRDPTDRVALRMLVSALGMSPLGTVVQLSTGEIGEVIADTTGRVDRERPRVRVVMDAQGAVLDAHPERDVWSRPTASGVHIAKVIGTDGWKKGLALRYGGLGKESSSVVSMSAGSPAALVASGRTATEPTTPSAVAPPAAPLTAAPMVPAHRPRSASSPMLSGSATPPPIPPSGTPPPISPSGPPPPIPPSGTPPPISWSTSGGRVSSTPPNPAQELGERTVFQPPSLARDRRDSWPVASPSATPSPIVSTPHVSMVPPAVPLPIVEGTRRVDASAKGTLGATPLVHTLVYMLDRSLSGSLELDEPGGAKHVLYFERGVPAKLMSSTPAARLGVLLVEDGFVDQPTLDRALAEAPQLGVLLGEYMVGDRYLAREDLLRTLTKQIVFRLGTLVNLPNATNYHFFRNVNTIDQWGGGETTPCHPIEAILGCVRRWHDRARLQVTLGRMARQSLALHPKAALDGFLVADAEAPVLAALRAGAQTFDGLVAAHIADEDAIATLLYALLITRQFAFTEAKGLPMGPARGAVESSRSGVRSSPADAPRARSSAVPPARTASSRPKSVGTIARSRPADLVEESIGEDVEVEFDPGEENAEAERALTAMTAFRMAEAALQNSDLATARAQSKLAAETDPQNIDYAALNAWVTALGPEPTALEMAIERLGALLSRDPRSVRGHLYRGKLLKRANRLRDAIRDLELVLELSPQHREAASELRLLRSRVAKGQ